MTVAAMCARNPVGMLKVHAYAYSNSLLSNTQMDKSRYFPLLVVILNGEFKFSDQ
jgi:hypothetical protein